MYAVYLCVTLVEHSPGLAVLTLAATTTPLSVTMALVRVEISRGN